MARSHVIPVGTRIYCCGTTVAPCVAHAWWYHEGKKGRPRLRCPVCRDRQRLIAEAESASVNPAPRCTACGFALPVRKPGFPRDYWSASYCVCGDLA